MFNKVFLIGRLGRDPEIRYTPNGTAVTTFSLATSSYAGGEEKTEWHRVVTFGSQAENAAQYLTKGRLVFVEGRISTDRWTDSNGNQRSSTKIIADRIKFLPTGEQVEGQEKKEEGDVGDVSVDVEVQKDGGIPDGEVSVSEDDDIPF